MGDAIVDDEYTEDDLEKDLRKTQVLPFTQVGTPSPYRAPAKTRVVRIVKSSAPLEMSTSMTPLAIVKPMNIKSNSTQSLPTQLPEGLKTPTTNVTEWSKPKPPVCVLPAPIFGNSAPKHEVQQQSASNNSSVKVVPSKYMQCVSKPDTASKSIKKSGSTTSRNPLAQVDVNNNAVQDPEKRRMTIAASKKPASKPVQIASSRPSVGPTMSSNQTSQKPSTQATITANATSNSSVTVAKPSSGNISTSTSQSELRAALLQRREQKAAAAAAAAEQKAAAKQAVATSKPSARPSLGHSSSNASLSGPAQRDTTAHQISAQTPHGDGRRTLTRQQSSCLESASKHRASLNEPSGNAKVVASRYMNTNLASKGAVKDVDEELDSCSAPTPTRTPGSLKRSFSTSSIKKMPSAKKSAASSQAAQTEAAKKEASAHHQIANFSARVSNALSSSGASNVTIPTQRKEPTVNMQALQMETQLMQSQLLQWHVINRRLEQARIAKRATGTHMMLAVLNKIEAMRRASDEAEAELNARQAQVYQADLEEFKISCLKPIMQNVERFLHTYSDTATQLERDTHKMPMIGIEPVEPRSLMVALTESHQLLTSMQQDCLEQFTEWNKTGAAARKLSETVQEEIREIKSYSEVLHALSSLGNQEASLIIHKHQLQEHEYQRIARME